MHISKTNCWERREWEVSDCDDPVIIWHIVHKGHNEIRRIVIITTHRNKFATAVFLSIQFDNILQIIGEITVNVEENA